MMMNMWKTKNKVNNNSNICSKIDTEYHMVIRTITQTEYLSKIYILVFNSVINYVLQECVLEKIHELLTHIISASIHLT